MSCLFVVTTDRIDAVSVRMDSTSFGRLGRATSFSSETEFGCAMCNVALWEFSWHMLDYWVSF